jgi:hypothetical protein
MKKYFCYIPIVGIILTFIYNEESVIHSSKNHFAATLIIQIVSVTLTAIFIVMVFLQNLRPSGIT